MIMLGQRAPREPQYPAVAPYRGRTGIRRRIPIPVQPGHIYVPLSVLEATSRVMRRFGDENRECYVWWGGSFNSAGDGQVATMYCPEVPTDFGRIELDRHDLAALHAELRARDQVLLVELHTHPPGAGGQNEVDAAHPAATYDGFITVVVPDFAYPYLHDLRRCYVYAYAGRCQWTQLSPDDIQVKFTIEEHSVMVPRK
jgi:hypothetical protein